MVKIDSISMSLKILTLETSFQNSVLNENYNKL